VLVLNEADIYFTQKEQRERDISPFKQAGNQQRKSFILKAETK
jgi:hypothetical protein